VAALFEVVEVELLELEVPVLEPEALVVMVVLVPTVVEEPPEAVVVREPAIVVVTLLLLPPAEVETALVDTVTPVVLVPTQEVSVPPRTVTGEEYCRSPLLSRICKVR